MLVPRTNLMIFFINRNVHSLSLQLHWGVFSLPSLPPFSLLVKLGLRRIWRDCGWPLDIIRTTYTYYVYVYLYVWNWLFGEHSCGVSPPKTNSKGRSCRWQALYWKGFAQKGKNAVFAMNAAFLLSLKQYVILYLYVVLTYFMCTFPKKAQKFCDLLLNRNLHTVSIPQIYHLWKGNWALPLPNHSARWK